MAIGPFPGRERGSAALILKRKTAASRKSWLTFGRSETF
jgi:hypothetical protein